MGKRSGFRMCDEEEILVVLRKQQHTNGALPKFLTHGVNQWTLINVDRLLLISTIASAR
jgi:hypothetical protein